MALSGRRGTSQGLASSAGRERPPHLEDRWHLSETLSDLARLEPVRRAGTLFSYALFAGLVGVLLLVATATVPVLFGYHTYVVNGGSMEPSLGAGSVAVTHPTSPRALEVGDVIAWRASSASKAVLHRIIEVQQTDGRRLFITQGDQNRTPDATSVELAGQGDRVVYSVPYAGYILNFAQSGAGRVVLVGLPLVLLAALLVREGRLLPQASGRPAMVTAAPVPRPIAQPAAGRVPRLAVPEPQPRPVLVSMAPATEAGDLPVFLVRQLRRLPVAVREPVPFRAPAAGDMPGFGAGRRERPAA